MSHLDDVKKKLDEGYVEIDKLAEKFDMSAPLNQQIIESLGAMNEVTHFMTISPTLLKFLKECKRD